MIPVLLPLLLTPSQVMAVSCAAFGLGSVATADCPGDGNSRVGWEGVAASSCSAASNLCLFFSV